MTTLPIPLLPVLTTLIGTGGFTVGLYSFINPTAAARIYGIPISGTNIKQQSSYTSILGTTRSAHRSAGPSDHNPTVEAQPDLYAESLSLIHALGVRNFTAGLTILSVTAYWQFMLGEGVKSSAVRLAVQRVLGLVIVIGSLVPMVDAWVCLQRSRDVFEKREARHKKISAMIKGRESVSSNTDIWKGAEDEYEAFVTGKKAGMLHAARSLVWLIGGLWCSIA